MAAGITITLSRGFKSKEVSITDASESLVVDNLLNWEKTLPASASNAQFAATFAFANIKALGISCKGGEAGITLKTNSTSTPGDTITIKPNAPLIWSVNDNGACPFTANVTAIYITNNSADEMDIAIGVAIDSTPGLSD
jgi:hypothetical protein